MVLLVKYFKVNSFHFFRKMNIFRIASSPEDIPDLDYPGIYPYQKKFLGTVLYLFSIPRVMHSISCVHLN